MNYCTRCNNPLKVSHLRERSHRGMGVYKMVIVATKEWCPYCDWKGDTGPGTELKETIKQANKRSQ